jgi:HK97 gp10 family phage protein
MSDVRLKFFSRFEETKLRQAVAEAVIDPLLKCGALVERTAKVSMKEGGHLPGRKTGVPSTPPAPPHVQTGNLRASISYALTENKKSCIVGSTRMAWYGKIHEYGGEFGGRHYPARPFMWPALLANKSNIARLLKLDLKNTATGRQMKPK